jgi:hypothetical protein
MAVGVVAEADATIAEDAGKGIDALAHVSNALATSLWRDSLGRVSSAEYYQGAFGQKAALLNCNGFSGLSDWGTPPCRPLAQLIHGLEAVSFAKTAPANQQVMTSTRPFVM